MQRAEAKKQSRDQVIEWIKDWKESGRVVGFTSGAFDLLHAGHVAYLQEARSRCDVLVVGVNSDSSIKSYKSPDRPIVSEEHRAFVLAGLAAVDCVFIFSEDNNNKNIELLQPAIYFKAGDYDESRLTSAPLVRAQGGDVQIIPFKAGCSTSSIIARIESAVGVRATEANAQPPTEQRPAIFLDRDGTLVEHVQYLHEPEQVRFFSDGLTPLKQLQDAGYRIVMITNQPGIGLGYFTKEDFYRTNLEVFKEASKVGLLFDKVYFSPFGKADASPCRKPGRGLVDRAVQELNLDLENSFVIGDTTTDMQLARNVGCTGVLVQTGYAGTDGLYEATGDVQVTGIAAAVRYILEKHTD